MSKPVEYTVMGDDGKEYGPVSARQIRQWVEEGRLEKKTPLKPSDARDWVFLGDVREFGGLFTGPKMRKPKIGPRRGLVKTFLVLAVITALYYLYLYLTTKSR